MLSDKRTQELRQLAAEVLSRARTDRLFANDHLVHVAEQIAYGLLMLSRDKASPPSAADSYQDAVETLLRGVSDAVDTFFAERATNHLEHTPPALRMDVLVAARAYQNRNFAPNLRLAAGDHDEKYMRVYLLEAITIVIKEGREMPSVEDFANAITFSTGIYDQRTEPEVEADADRLCRLYHEIKHKDQTQ